jgi:hypothetical protein
MMTEQHRLDLRCTDTAMRTVRKHSTWMSKVCAFVMEEGAPSGCPALGAKT